MIRRIRLTDWRCYGDDTVEFDRPVVFFVAPNGVGKSSLYQAARAALFGFDGPATKRGRAVRAGQERAEIRADVDVDDQELSIHRTLRSSGATTFDATLDGTQVSEDEIQALLQRAWGAETPLLDRLAFGDADPSVRGSGKLPVRDHLAELLGATPLLEAAAALNEAESAARSRVSTLRASASDPDTVRAAEQAVADAQQQVHDAEEAVAAHRPVLQAAEASAATAAAWGQYRSQLSEHETKLNELLADVRAVASVTDTGAMHEALESVSDTVATDVDEAQATVQHLGNAVARADAAADALVGADLCPTCLRPLTADERDHAIRIHRDTTDASTVDTTEAEHRLASAKRHSEQVRDLMRRLDRLQPPAPPAGDDPGPEAAVALDEERRRARLLSEQLGEWRGRLAGAKQKVEELRAADEDNRALVVASREELMLGASAKVMDRLATRIVAEHLEPVTREVTYRWKKLFGSDGLILSPDGEIQLHLPGRDLSHKDLSGGEVVTAGVVVRLIVASAVTRLPTVWFDEPLEHLDPRRRTAVARTLVNAVQAGPLPSIVVTTYEEQIARQLELTNPETVKVAYATATADNPG